MSGSSLDGVDIMYATITSTAQHWEYQIECAETITYNQEWINALQKFPSVSFPEYATLHTAYGKYLGQLVQKFIADHELEHKVHFIASHGHTIFHQPEHNTSVQLGDGASIAATTGITTITELRQMDMAYGGQGAPIVPIADQLLFSDYKYCLNLGGIANISIKENDGIKAFDICAANQVLNYFAQKANQEFDDKGTLAAQGVADQTIINNLHQLAYFQHKGAKSLSNNFSAESIIPQLAPLSIEDALHTACKHIALEIKTALLKYELNEAPTQLLVTGGGAHNDFLMLCIQEELTSLNISVVKPADDIINYKEALAMALIGILRWKEEANVLSSVTGATENSIGGALWLAH